MLFSIKFCLRLCNTPLWYGYIYHMNRYMQMNVRLSFYICFYSSISISVVFVQWRARYTLHAHINIPLILCIPSLLNIKIDNCIKYIAKREIYQLNSIEINYTYHEAHINHLTLKMQKAIRMQLKQNLSNSHLQITCITLLAVDYITCIFLKKKKKYFYIKRQTRYSNILIGLDWIYGKFKIKIFIWNF